MPSGILEPRLRSPLSRYCTTINCPLLARRDWVRSIKSRVISSTNREDLPLYRGIPLPVRALLGTRSDESPARHECPRGYVLARNDPLQHFQCGNRLVEWDFVTRFIYADISKVASLLNLTVYHTV